MQEWKGANIGTKKNIKEKEGNEMSKKDFKLTLKGLIEILEVEGIGSKQTVLKRLKNATMDDLRDLQYSIQTEINERYAKDYLS